jgi:AraC-like DNA-binding protein
MKRILLTTIFFFSIFIGLKAQDTVFVAKHNFSSPVRNVFNVGREVYTKTGENLYLLVGEEWVDQKIQFKKAYVFFRDNFYESDFIPNTELFDASKMRELIPQKGLFITTSAKKDSRLFIASGSSLFEYHIFDHYTKSYYNKSIRDIFINDSLKVISTYSGIYVNDSILLEKPEYSNGPLTVFNNSYYLNSDELFQFYPPDSTSLISTATNVFAGNIRKIVEWRGQIYSQNTQSINLLSNNFELNPIHKDYEYLDLEPIPEGLLFSTSDGKFLFFDGNQVTQLADLGIRIRDIYPSENLIYLSTDEGVYTIENLTPTTLKKITETRLNVHVEKDNVGNTWISTENGLYIISKDNPSVLPLIEGVEFNREAFLYHNDYVYVGAVDGLYILNAVEVSKSYIPAAINKLEPNSPIGLKTFLLIIASLSIIGFLVYFFLRNKKSDYPISEEVKANRINLQLLEELIIENKLNSVEAISSHLETNTVQLNRNFREFNITPGKFLKKVKLKHARQLLKEGNSLEEVASQIGYSVRFLKNELE